MMEAGEGELPEKRSKQQNGLKNFKHHSLLITLNKSRDNLKYRVNTHYSMFQHIMSGADVLQFACEA